jgi:hypothetical protein
VGRIITLTTDFGLSDAYVGVMKGVILRIAPQATIVDICHDIAAQDVLAAGFLLAGAYSYFTEGTIHVAVVDPGVGTSRRAIAIKDGGYIFVGPDNGIFSFILCAPASAALQAVHLTNRDYWLAAPSATFHGRDIFAPVAAHLAAGVPLAALGTEVAVDDLVRLPLPRSERRGDVIYGEVVHVDHFGNLVSNITATSLHDPHALLVEIAGVRISGLSPSYAAGEAGQPMALIGSTGYLEIAVPGGSAARVLMAGKGTPVAVIDRISAP